MVGSKLPRVYLKLIRMEAEILIGRYGRQNLYRL
jgi:hypothetical protein